MFLRGNSIIFILRKRYWRLVFLGRRSLRIRNKIGNFGFCISSQLLGTQREFMFLNLLMSCREIHIILFFLRNYIFEILSITSIKTPQVIDQKHSFIIHFFYFFCFKFILLIQLCHFLNKWKEPIITGDVYIIFFIFSFKKSKKRFFIFNIHSRLKTLENKFFVIFKKFIAFIDACKILVGKSFEITYNRLDQRKNRECGNFCNDISFFFNSFIWFLP